MFTYGSYAYYLKKKIVFSASYIKLYFHEQAVGPSPCLLSLRSPQNETDVWLPCLTT